MGLIPVGDSDLLSVPRSFHVDQFTFHISLSSLRFTIFIHLPKPNLLQHVSTCRTGVAKLSQHAATNNVALCCVQMLLSFGLGCRLKPPQRFNNNNNNDNDNHNGNNNNKDDDDKKNNKIVFLKLPATATTLRIANKNND